MLTNESVCICQGCGVSMPTPAALGHCPSCLMQLGLNANAAPTQPRAKASSLPRRFGDYELVREIGRGGMGVVYEARQISLNRTVALKLVLESLFSSPVALRRFEIEAEAAARLNHPHIVPIYEISHDDDQPFISMRLIPGKSLAQHVAAGAFQRSIGALSAKETESLQTRIVTLIATLARAVHYAHEHGVLHRDIKPGNILIDADGSPHLTDFGLAKLIDSDNNLSHTGAFFGTPNYMAPELATGNQATVGTDVYSLGAILYELLTGKLPFKADSTAEFLRLAAGTPPLRPRVLNPDIDRDLETICLKCLEKLPQQRYASAFALAEDLERWERDEPVLARPIGPIVRTLRWTRRHAMRTALIVSLLLGTGVSLWYQRVAAKKHTDLEVAEQRAADAKRAADAASARLALVRARIESEAGRGAWTDPNAVVIIPSAILAQLIDAPPAVAAPSAARDVTIGMFLEENPVDVVLGYAPLFAELEQKVTNSLGFRVLLNMRLFPKYSPKGIECLSKNEVQILKAGVNWYRKARQLDPGVRPIAGQNPNKTGVIFARWETGISSIHELLTRSIARRDGTIGYWGAFELLEAGIPLDRINLLPLPSEPDFNTRAGMVAEGKKATFIQPSIEYVLEGRFDAGIVQEKHFETHPRKGELIRLHTYPSSRIFWLAGSQLDARVAEHLTSALEGLPPKMFSGLPDKVKSYSRVHPSELERLEDAEVKMPDSLEEAD